MTRKSLVWITRPQPGADRTAAALREAGYEPLVLPLTEIRPVDPGVSPDDLAAFEAVAVTSANALRHAPVWVIEALRDKLLFAVGDATAAEARSHGFAIVRSAAGDVDHLLALIASTLHPGARVAYPCGSPRNGDLDGKLQQAGFPARTIEVYRTEIVSYPTDFWRDFAARPTPSAVLFHSGSSALAFRDLALSLPAQLHENTCLIAMSERVSRNLAGSVPGRMSVAATPDEDGMLAALQKMLPAAGH